MISQAKSEMSSGRRILPLLGLGAAAGLALRSTAAEAQTSGMERRQDRSGERVERRYERRGGTPAAKQPTARPACAASGYTRPVRRTKAVIA